jgi:hypothetical protein
MDARPRDQNFVRQPLRVPDLAPRAEEYRWRSMACAVRAKADKAWFAIRGGPGSEPPPGLYAETDRLQKLADDLFDRIIVTPAETLAGILAKLEVGYDDDDIPRKILTK